MPPHMWPQLVHLPDGPWEAPRELCLRSCAVSCGQDSREGAAPAPGRALSLLRGS